MNSDIYKQKPRDLGVILTGELPSAVLHDFNGGVLDKRLRNLLASYNGETIVVSVYDDFGDLKLSVGDHLVAKSAVCLPFTVWVALDFPEFDMQAAGTDVVATWVSEHCELPLWVAESIEKGDLS